MCSSDLVFAAGASHLHLSRPGGDLNKIPDSCLPDERNASGSRASKERSIKLAEEDPGRRATGVVSMDQGLSKVERDRHARHDRNRNAGRFRDQAIWFALRNIQVVTDRAALQVQTALRKRWSGSVTLPAQQVVC